MVFDPSLVNFTVINGLISIYTVNTSTPMHKFYPCIPSIQPLEWVETMPDDQMLGSSVYASEKGRTPNYISVWVQAQDANRKIEALIMESPKDMLAWTNLEQCITVKIRDASPAWMFDQHLQVFYTTLTSNEEEVSWLRNCLLTPYSDNAVLTHLKASIHPYDDFLSIHEMMKEHGLISQQVTDESTETTVMIFKSLDSSYEIMHILTCHLVVHLVGEKSAVAFETFAEQCRHHGPRLSIFAGHIHPKLAGGPELHSPPPPERYPSYTDHGRTKRRMLVY
jgi:hypothetical protein